MFIEDTIVVPATVKDEVELNSATPISKALTAYEAVAAYEADVTELVKK